MTSYLITLSTFKSYHFVGFGDRVHRITMDLQGCQPDDVKISVEDNVVSNQ